MKVGKQQKNRRYMLVVLNEIPITTHMCIDSIFLYFETDRQQKIGDLFFYKKETAITGIPLQ